MEPEGYIVRESTRAKRLSITVHPDGQVIVTKPMRVSVQRAERFVEMQREWIMRAQKRLMAHVARTGTRIPISTPRKGTKAYKDAVRDARALVTTELTTLSQKHGFAYRRVSIRDQKTRWGSCSARGDLSFSYRIIYLPQPLQEYILVHELCHTRELNHSPQFWKEVSCIVPDWQARRRELQRYQ